MLNRLSGRVYRANLKKPSRSEIYIQGSDGSRTALRPVLQAENAASDRAALLRQKGARNKAISKAVRAQEKLRRKGLRHIE